MKKENTPPTSEYARDERLDVIYLLETINEVTASEHEDKILVTDVGNHQMWPPSASRSPVPTRS